MWWVIGVAAAYLVLAPVVLAGTLLAMLTAGVVDWAGHKRAAPADPLLIGYRGDPEAAFGWPFAAVHYPSPLGDAEAWLVPSAAGEARSGGTWAIWVHGIGGTRENGYRIVRTLRDAGLPVLLVTYRNDLGAPRAADGLYSFGLEEWHDLDAAVSWALGQGAERIVIAAESMGGAIAGQYLARGGNREAVVGLVLDAPALDFNEVIAAGGRRYRVPLGAYVAMAGLSLFSMLRRDLRQAVALDAIAGFEGPIFLAHGEGDPLVPFSTSERLVARRPDIAFWRTRSDRHPMSFEADREGYSGALRSWLEKVTAQSGR